MSEIPHTQEPDAQESSDAEISNLFEVLAGTKYENTENGDVWQLIGASNNDSANYSVKLVDKQGNILIKSAKDFIKQIHAGVWKAQ